MNFKTRAQQQNTRIVEALAELYSGKPVGSVVIGHACQMEHAEVLKYLHAAKDNGRAKPVYSSPGGVIRGWAPSHVEVSESLAEPKAILRRLNEITREQLGWLWPGRIPIGKLTLLAGDPGLGKSFVTLDIAARVSRGDAWPDMPLLNQEPGGVVLLNCEDDPGDTIAPRPDKAGVDDTRVVLLEGVKHLDRRCQFSLESDLSRLQEILGQFTTTRLVVIDPIAAYCGNVDSHKNSDVRGMLAPLAELAGHHRIAILAVTHLSKSSGSKAVYPAMDSLAFAAAARAVWAIVKDSTTPTGGCFCRPSSISLAIPTDWLTASMMPASCGNASR